MNIHRVEYNPFSFWGTKGNTTAKYDTTVDNQNINHKKTFQKKLLIPPIIGTFVGFVASVLKKNSLYNEAQTKISNIKSALEKDFENNSLHKQTDALKRSTEQAIIDTRQRIEQYQKEIDRGCYIETNKEAIKNNKKFIDKCNLVVDECEQTLKNTKKILLDIPLKLKSSEILKNTKKQAKTFTSIFITSGVAIGLGTSFLLNNKREDK